MDQYLIAVIVGIVEGLTEFLPVSSTGHMIIVANMLGFDERIAHVFEVFVQLGAILSVIFIYKERFYRFFTKEGWQVDKGLSVWHIAAGTLPVMLIAFFLYDYIKEYLFGPFTVIYALVAGALLLMYAEYKTQGRQEQLVQDVDKITIKQALWIGIYQILSLWPGFSRSGSTIAGGLLVGLSREVAAHYTFLVAVPLMFVACSYDLLKNIHILNTGDFQILAIGFVTAFVVAYWSVLWFLKFLHKYSLSSFAYYRVCLAAFCYWYFYM